MTFIAAGRIKRPRAITIKRERTWEEEEVEVPTHRVLKQDRRHRLKIDEASEERLASRLTPFLFGRGIINERGRHECAT